jgi:hypothetical protein
MKWQIVCLLLLSGMVGANGLGWIKDGFILPREPFYVINTGQSCTFNLSIGNPTQNNTYYHNTEVMNVTLQGAIGNTTCYYSVNSHPLNVFDCVNQTITFPAGTVTLSVYAYDSLNCAGINSVTFYIWSYPPQLALIRYPFVLPALLLAFIVVTGGAWYVVVPKNSNVFKGER